MRLLTVFFAPNPTMPAVFSGTLGGPLGLGFGTGLVALLLGTVIGAIPVGFVVSAGAYALLRLVPSARGSLPEQHGDSG